MVAPIILAIPKLVNLGIETYQALLDVTMTLEQLCSDMSFSLFIMHECDDPERYNFYLDYYKTALLLYTHIATPDLFMIKYDEEIRADPELYDWYTQSVYLRSTMDAVKSAKEELNETDSLDYFIQGLLQFSSFGFMLTVKDIFIDNPGSYANEMAEQFLFMTEPANADMMARAKAKTQELSKTEVRKIVLPVRQDMTAHLNPFLPFYFATLSAHIHSYNAFKNNQITPGIPTVPKALLRALRNDVYLNDELVSFNYPDPNLSLIHTVEKDDPTYQKPGTIAFDYAGLREYLKSNMLYYSILSLFKVHSEVTDKTVEGWDLEYTNDWEDIYKTTSIYSKNDDSMTHPLFYMWFYLGTIDPLTSPKSGYIMIFIYDDQEDYRAEIWGAEGDIPGTLYVKNTDIEFYCPASYVYRRPGNDPVYSSYQGTLMINKKTYEVTDCHFDC